MRGPGRRGGSAVEGGLRRPAQPVRPSQIGDPYALAAEPLLAARRRRLRLRLRAVAPFVVAGRLLWRQHGHLVAAGFALSLAGSTAVAASMAFTTPSAVLAVHVRHHRGAVSTTVPAQLAEGDLSGAELSVRAGRPT